MCNRPLEVKFEKQQSSEKISFPTQTVSLGFTGPTVKVPAILASLPKTKSLIINGATLTVNEPICEITDSKLNFDAILDISRLKSGPYSDTGGQINFKELFYNFFDLEIQFVGNYQFDPKLVCDDSIPQTYNLDNKPFQIQNIKSISFDKNKYFASNTDDDSNINKLQYDLIDLFMDASGPFVPIFKDVTNSLLNQTGFGRQVNAEMNRVYCESKGTKQLVNTFSLYDEKIKVLQQNGIYELILKRN